MKAVSDFLPCGRAEHGNAEPSAAHRLDAGKTPGNPARPPSWQLRSLRRQDMPDPPDHAG